MNREKLSAWRSWIRAELDRSVDFWLTHGMDAENGGVYTCLTRDGMVFSADKSGAVPPVRAAPGMARGEPLVP